MIKRGKMIAALVLAFALQATAFFPGFTTIAVAEEVNGEVERTPVQAGEHKNTTTFEVQGGKLYFDLDEGSIYWAEGDMKELTIPEKIDGKKVKTIGRWAFSKLDKLKRINLPKAQNVLGEGSFAEMKALEEFAIPDTCTEIPKSCFYGCPRLKKVSLPSSVTKIGDMAFYQCRSLEYVDIPGSCMTIDRMAFYECTALKGVAFVKGSTCDISSWGIFYGCYSLDKVVNIPSKRLETFYESGKKAEIWLDTPEMIENQREMWRLRFPTSDEREAGISELSETEIKKREDAIRTLALDVTKGCATDREKIRSVMLWIIRHIDYELGHDNHPWAIYTGILDAEAGKKKEQLNSCGGYSNMTQVMLESLGIPCATLWRENKNGESIDHEFNAAYFEGKWRWLDTTHSDNEEEDDSELELDVRTPGFFFDSDHRVDYLLYRSGRNGDTNIYKELPADIEVKEDVKDWPDQNPADAYEVGEAEGDADWVHETDPAELAAEQERIRQREAEFPSIPESSEGLFDFDASSGTITGFHGDGETRICIPEKIGGVTVKAIGEEAFIYKRSLEYVTMPDTITTIGDSAFSGCSALKRIHLSGSLKRMSTYMFMNCDSLETITIPASVYQMGSTVFGSCDSLEEALFEDHDFKIKVIETDPLGSDDNIENGTADISWYCFAGMSGRALHGLDFHETYIGTKYYKQLQELTLTDDWRQNIVNIHKSQMGYREGFSPYHLDGSNSKEFKLSGRAVYHEWGHFSEAGRFTGIQPTTWCRAFIQWAYAMAGVSRNHNSKEYLTEFTWEDTVYAGKGGTMELKPGDMLGMGKTHWCMVGSVKELKDSVEIHILHGNHENRMVMDETRHYDKKTGIATDMEDEDYNYFRALYQVDFSKMKTRTVTLDAGEGQCDVKSRIYCEDAYYGCLPEAKKDGFVFDGWFTEKEGGEKAYPYRVLGDDITTLYAHYTYAPDAVKGVTMDRDSVKLSLGKKLALRAIIEPANAADPTVIWRSGNDEIVKAEDGVLTGLAEGKATVMARTRDGNYVAYCEVEVVKKGGEGEDEKPDPSAPDTVIKTGKKVKLKAGKKVAYTEVSDESVVKVKVKGKKLIVKGKATGTAVVSAYDKKGTKLRAWVIQVE